MRIAEMLRLYIAANGLEQKAVAAEIGINESTFCRFLAGNGTPDAQGMMRVIAWVSGVEPPKVNDMEKRLQAVERHVAASMPLGPVTYGPVRMGRAGG